MAPCKKRGIIMLFHVYGNNAIYQWLVMLAVLAGLILLNEFARRTKAGGLIMFGVIPAVLTAVSYTHLTLPTT